MTEVLEQQGRSPPSVPPINASRGSRRGRLISQPDSRMVEEARQAERARGGPPAPRNSLDHSVVTLDETVVVNEDNSEETLATVFVVDEESVGEERNSRDRRAMSEVNMSQDELVDGVPPTLIFFRELIGGVRQRGRTRAHACALNSMALARVRAHSVLKHQNCACP